MQWSQIKKRVESLFADAVKGRVELRTTAYHKAPDLLGRGWITIDGQEIVNMCSFKELVAVGREVQRLRQQAGCEDFRNPAQEKAYYAALDQAKTTVHDKGIFARWDFHHSLLNYLDLPMSRILASPDPIIRAIGMLDRRLGKRRLVGMNVKKEHPLVRRMFSFRCGAEGIDQVK